MHKQQGLPQAWEYSQAKPIQTLGRASQGVDWSWSQESPHPDVFRKRVTKPLLKRKQRQKHLTGAKEKNNWTVAQLSKVFFSDKSKFCISSGVWRKTGEAQNPSSLKSSVKFPQSVMIWGAVTSAGVGPLCFIKSKVNAAIYQEIFGALYASICWQALWRCWFPFPAGL